MFVLVFACLIFQHVRVSHKGICLDCCTCWFVTGSFEVVVVCWEVEGPCPISQCVERIFLQAGHLVIHSPRGGGNGSLPPAPRSLE